eukprot:268039_1
MSRKSPHNRDRDTLDAWVIFEHLYGAQRKDIIDYLMHQLYYLSDNDIDFFLPQLCTLLVSRDHTLSKQLECFILQKCMRSIDFAIKCFWNLHAMQFYSKIDKQRNRCDELRQNLEMIVVNGQLPRNLLAQLPSDIKQEIAEQDSPVPPIHEQKHNQSNGHHLPNHKSQQNKDTSDPLNGHRAPSLSSALPQPKVPSHVKEMNPNDPLLNGATEYLKKQRRCTYFNAELDFAHFLEGVSSALEQCDREDRSRLLEDNIRYANKCLPRGLYIPIALRASDSHKSLLRIVPNESKCLDSKQKVPFLLFCEIEQHVYPTSSPQICEELTESESALLSSSGLYVLIDEHRKRKHKAKEGDTEYRKSKAHHNPHTKKKKNPHRLKPTKRKPSRLQSRSQRKDQAKHKTDIKKPSKSGQKALRSLSSPPSIPKSQSDPIQGCKPLDHSTPTPPQRENTVSRTLDPVEYSISSKNYSDDEEMKQSPSNSDSNEHTVTSQRTEPSKSVTNTNSFKPNLLKISSIPSPCPRPVDKEAEEEMKRHLEAIKTFEPSDHKAKAMNYKNGGNPTLLAPTDKSKSHSSSQLIGLNSNNSRFGRSRTPEPDKVTRFKPFFRSKTINKTYLSKSDGDPITRHSSASPNRNETNTPPAPNPQIVLNSAPLSKTRSASDHSAPNVVIYRHPNYSNTKGKKWQYLRGKSMQWKDPFGEPWDKRTLRYKNNSPFKQYTQWGMQSVIFKSGEDMRQEQMAMQFIKLFDKIWRDAKLPLQLRPYSVIVTSPASGFVETVPNSVSISRLKHSVTNFVSLRKFFEQFYGPIGSPGFQMAQKNFVESMAGYSLVAYFLQIKDRHNGNILLTSEGRVVHIDFDFLFSNSPGGNIGFESAPFKLTEEFIEVMGGEENSEMFDYFKILLIRGFLEARKHVRKFVLMSRIMLEGAPMPCFLGGKTVIDLLQDRFATKLKNEKCVEHVYNLIEESSCNWRSVQYDKFQRITNNIL